MGTAQECQGERETARPTGLHVADTYVDRRHVHDNDCPGLGLPHDRRPQVHRPRRTRDGEVSRRAAASQRPLLPCARCAVLLGTRRRLDGCGPHRSAGRFAQGQPLLQTHHERLPKDDEEPPALPQRRGTVEPTHRPARLLDRDVRLRHVHLCLHPRRQEGMAVCQDLCPGCTQGLARPYSLYKQQR